MSDPKIDDLGEEVKEMQTRAAVCQAVAAGVIEMRKQAKTYLPQRAMEDQKTWDSRRDEAEFFPAFAHALEAYIGKPLGSPIVFKDVPPAVEAGFENLDKCGADADTFFREVLKAGLRDGCTYVVADYAKVPQGATLAQERALGARPYLIHVPLDKVIDFRTQAGEDGTVTFTHFRYKECVQVPVNRWGTKEVERIRVLDPGMVEVWEKQVLTVGGQPVWVLLEDLSGPVSVQEVPVACYRPKKDGPPLEDLAWLNVTHWQSSSYQRAVLNVARVPLLACDTDVREDPNAPVVIGVKGLITGLENLHYVEHQGAAIQAGKEDLHDLEDQMRRVAGQMLVAEGGQKTAREASLESSDGSSKLRAWVNTFHDFVEECLRLMALWVRESAGGSAELDMDWDEEEVNALVLTALSTMRDKGQISQDVLFWNIQKGGLVPPDRTLEDEQAALEKEGPQPMPAVLPFAPKPKVGPDGKPMPPDGTMQQGA